MTGMCLQVFFGADFFQQIHAGDFGQHQIEDDDIGVERIDDFKADLAIEGNFDLRNFRRQTCCDKYWQRVDRPR